ncbi:MAG: hypothetical protein AABY84_04165 [Candidatus Firestonebacteria bacterium]
MKKIVDLSVRIAKVCLAVFVLAMIFETIGEAVVKPNEVLILVDGNSGVSKRVGEYYALKRGIPVENILYLNLSSNVIVTYSLTEYQTTIEQPVVNYIQNTNPSIKCIVLSWGFAIKVDIDPKIDRDESANKSEASVLASMQYEEGRIAGNGRIELDVAGMAGEG